MRTTGGIRTCDIHFRRKVALSAELQRYAERRLGLKTNAKYFRILIVDKSDTLLIRQKVAILSYKKKASSEMAGPFLFINNDSKEFIAVT